MKSKTIRLILNKKITEWIASIKDEELQKLVKRDTIVTGGAIASMLLKEPISDFDIYFKTQSTTTSVANYYLSQFIAENPLARNNIKVQVLDNRVRFAVSEGYRGTTVGNTEDLTESGGQVEDTYQEMEQAALETKEEKNKYRPVFLSSNAITLSDKIQIVIRFFGQPDQIHENYDFVHCTNYWTAADNKLVLKLEALEALMAKELRYIGSKYPLCSIIRIRKFIARGWSINAGQILKMVMQLHELNLLDPKVLEDQLTGVDSAYFCQLIAQVNEKDPEKVNAAYLVEIIDRIF